MTPGDPRPVFDRAALDRQTGGDRDLQADVIRMFLDDCPTHVEAIRAAVAAADAARLRSSAHALKGSAAYLSAAFVVEAAAAIEAIGRDGRLEAAAAWMARLDAAVAELLPELRASL